MPQNVKLARVYVEINGTISVLETTTGIATFTGEAGVYNVRAVFVDIFGEGEYSETELATVKSEIPQEWLKNMKVGMAQVDEAIKAALEKGAKAADNYVNIVGRVDSVANAASNAQGTANAANQKADAVQRNVESAYSAITQLRDAVNLRVVKGDVINQINVSPDGIKIDGKFLHITGLTKFDDGVIVGKMLSANSVTADKLQVESLSAMTARIGKLRTSTTGARTEISDNIIEVFDSNNQVRVRIGVFE